MIMKFIRTILIKLNFICLCYPSFCILNTCIICHGLNICNSNAFASRRRLQVHTRSWGMEEVYISVLIVKLLSCIICVYAHTQQIFFIFHSVNAHRKIAQKNTRGRDQRRVRNCCWGRGINAIIYVMLTIYIFKWMVI